jgi:GDPmannose 4,6-dehydratase
MKALITGITGQDGSYLAEFLLSRGYEVHGTLRLSTKDNLDNIGHIAKRLHLHRIDMLDQMALLDLIDRVRPNEIYNLAAITAPDTDWDMAELYGQYNALGVVRLLDAVRKVNPDIKFFQASSYEMLARSEKPLNESSDTRPDTPAAVAKQYAHSMVKSYRTKYKMNISTGILFEHTSPRRDTRFITRQITQAAAKIKLGLQEKLQLETLAVTRDWGFSGDYVRAFWMMLQHATPGDYVVATGQAHTLEEFCKLAFDTVDLDWQDHIVIKQPEMISTKKDIRIGDASFVRRQLLWEPEIQFERLVGMMVEADLERLTLKNRLSTYLLQNEELEETSA